MSELHFGIITEYLIDYFEITADTRATEPDNTTVDYDLEGSAIATTGTVHAAELNITLTGLSSNTTYQIAVAAMNGAGFSPFANITRSIPPCKLFCIYVTRFEITHLPCTQRKDTLFSMSR